MAAWAWGHLVMLEQGQYHQAAGQPGTSQLGLDIQWTGMFIAYADVAIH